MDGYVPGMNAISYIHDVWADMGNGCESDICVTTMLPAAVVSYGALYDSVQRSGRSETAFVSDGMQVWR